MKIIHSIIVVAILLVSTQSLAFDHTHSAFTGVLQKHVILSDQGRVTKVDYAALKKNPAELDAYLNKLSGVGKKEFSSWNKDRQLAFLINVYNAFTIDLILKNYPVESIRQTGSLMKSPWKIKFIPLLDSTVSLDDIEHGMVREKGTFDEPRIHFALVCASVGCPALQNRAFTPDRLEEMLEKGLVSFLSDKTRNRYNHLEKRFEVSEIFKWYGDDFNPRYGSVRELLQHYSRYLVTSETNIESAKKTNTIRFLDYDWSLNGY